MDSSSYDSKEHKEVAQTNCFNISNDGIFEFEGRCNGANSYSFLDDTPLDDLINHLLLHLTTNHLTSSSSILLLTTSSSILLPAVSFLSNILWSSCPFQQQWSPSRFQIIISLKVIKVPVSGYHSTPPQHDALQQKNYNFNVQNSSSCARELSEISQMWNLPFDESSNSLQF